MNSKDKKNDYLYRSLQKYKDFFFKIKISKAE